MSNSLSVELRTGYLEVVRTLPYLAGEYPRPASAKANCRGGETLLAAVLAYRAGQRGVWGPVLLELLAPGLIARLRRLRSQIPVVDSDDIRQQLILEVLSAAATMPLPEQPALLQRRLISRANQGVRRWLARERARQSHQRPLTAYSTCSCGEHGRRGGLENH